MVTLAMTNQEGKILASDRLPGPGGEVRFGVGSPTGPRSGTWRLWANKTTSDVYLASRPLAGVQKVSLHESGEWLFQYVSREIAEQWAPGQGRLLNRWSRPPETIPGWTRSLIVWVPEPDVTAVPAGNEEHKEIKWIPKPVPGEVVAFQVVIARPDTGIVELERTIPMHAFSLANGETCLLLVSYEPLTPDRAEWLHETRARVMASLGPVDLSRAKAPRVALFGTDAEGLRSMWDLSVVTVRPS